MDLVSGHPLLPVPLVASSQCSFPALRQQIPAFVSSDVHANHNRQTKDVIALLNGASFLFIVFTSVILVVAEIWGT